MTGRENYMLRELPGWLGRACHTCLWSDGGDLREVGTVKREQITVCAVSTWYSPVEDVCVHSKELMASIWTKSRAMLSCLHVKN